MPPHPETWLRVTPQGLYCEPGDFFIDPPRPVERAVITHGHADHARPGHGAVLATPETLAIMRRAHGRGARRARRSSRSAYGEAVDAERRRASAWCRPAMCWARRRWCWTGRGSRAVVSGDYKRQPRPDLRALRAGALRRLRHRGDLRPAGVPPPAGRATRSRKLLQSLALFPERTHVVGCYALGKCQRLIALLREAGWDRPIYLHGALAALCALYEALGVPLGPLRAGDGGQARRRWPAPIVLAPPSAVHDRWARRLAEPVVGGGLAAGCGCGSGRRQRGVELPLVISDHADWDELNRDHRRGRRARGLGDAWPRGRAGACAGAARHPRPGAAPGRAGEEDEDDAPMPRGRGMSVARLRRAAGAAGLHPRPQRQARPAARLVRRPSRTPTAGSALAALTEELVFTAAKPALIRDLVAARTDPVLLALSHDYVGDFAETVALIWPQRERRERPAAGAVRGGRGAGADAEIRAAGADRAAGSTRWMPAAGWR